MTKLPPPANANRIHLSLSVAKLQLLLAQGAICINDLADVQADAKPILWQLCLQNCKSGACERRPNAMNDKLQLKLKHLD
ncbi:hypothetical protein ACVFI8_11390 [Agarivorans sp. MS3-6]|uniref:hypothetical protein n=1 Tax=Agarivorans sp. TSD2052 TaxID=2937286 RepID=UPI00200E98DB|nr:hypothetical protein [Agarivorans sp. TSD2052]UPW18430.1 hypothetical protein M0C34_19745 [Agarivorans sp. TSD2052]